MEEENKVIEEKANIGFAILSFLIPIVGLIIYLVWTDKRPKTAKLSGAFALISFVLSAVISIIVVIASVAIGFGIQQKARDIVAEDASRYVDYYSNSNRTKDSDVYDVLSSAKEQVALDIVDAYTEYANDKYVNDNDDANVEKYLIEALKETKSRLKELGVNLTTSGNKIYLTYNEYSVTGTISDNSSYVTWETIE